MITVTTQIVIIGYELQVRRLGEAVATKTGQPYYPQALRAVFLGTCQDGHWLIRCLQNLSIGSISACCRCRRHSGCVFLDCFSLSSDRPYMASVGSVGDDIPRCRISQHHHFDHARPGWRDSGRLPLRNIASLSPRRSSAWDFRQSHASHLFCGIPSQVAAVGAHHRGSLPR